MSEKFTIIDLFESSVAQFGNQPFLWEKNTDTFQPTTYQQTYHIATTFGAGLVSIGLNFGEHVGLLAEGCNAWITSELGIFYAGGVSIPLSIKLEEEQDLLFRLQHSETTYIITSSSQLHKIRTIVNSLPLVKKIILLDNATVALHDNEISYAEVLKAGKIYLEKHREVFFAIKNKLQNSTIATITYTSGTTADPKGVMLSHRNYTANVDQALTCVKVTPDMRTLIILPLDHCFAHVVGFYAFMRKGSQVATVQQGKTPIETLKNIPVNIREFKPHVLLSVPALAKNLKKNIENGISAKGKLTQSLFRWALKTSYIYNGVGFNKGKGLRIMLLPLVKLFDIILYKKVRQVLGGKLRFFIGGGALLDIELQRFFYAIGIPMFQGYGLSEATPVISTNAPQRHKFGTSGILVQPLELKIMSNDGKELPKGQNGEIVIKGENVMIGYYKNPHSTQETVKDGWLYTGDLGYMDEHNFLVVKGRFKSLLISNDGEKYSPEAIEEALVNNSQSIEQAMLYNNQSPYTVGLIVPCFEKIKKMPQCPPLNTQEGKTFVINTIVAEINRYKSGGNLSHLFPERWLPSTFAIISEPFSEKNQMINSTMKMVRGKIETVYQNKIQYLYTPQGKNPHNTVNQENIGMFSSL